MNKQRRTSNINNIVVYDAAGNVTLPANLVVSAQLRLSNYTSGSSYPGTIVGFLAFDSSGNILTTATPVANAITFNNAGSGDASGTTYNGSVARTISYNTVGAAAASHVHDDRYLLYTASNEVANLAVGWYTIAVNSGDRASAKFILRDTSSGNHQSTVFYATHHFGAYSDITVLSNSRYSGDPFSNIRIKTGTTYDGALLQIYIDLASNTVKTWMLENIQANGWVLKNWIPDGTDPGGLGNFAALVTTTAEISLNQIPNGGISSTGDIYGGGNTTQYLHLHTNNYNSYAPTLTGTGASGTWGISITGNAVTATTATNWGAYGAVPGAGTSFANPNTIGRSDGSGYTYFGYINSSTGNSENPAISQVIVTNGSDNFYRKASIAHLTTAVQTAAAGSTWSINVTGSSASSTDALKLVFADGPRDLTNRLPNTFTRTVIYDFVTAGIANGVGNYAGVMTFSPWTGTSASTGDSSYQLGFVNETGNNGTGLPGLTLRKGIDTTWGSWYNIYHTGNLDAPNRKTNASNYYDVNTWFAMNGTHGMYWPGNYGAHFQVNTTSTFAQFMIIGNKGGYGGFYDFYSGVNPIMFDSSGNGGAYRESTAKWYWYYNVANDCVGIGGSTTSSSYRLYVNGATYIAGSLTASGDITAFSDARVKENIVTISDALSKVNNLRGVYFTRKDSDDTAVGMGVIAQEVNEVVPEVVKKNNEGMYSVAYGNLVGLLIEAVKEQQLQIEDLSNQINFLANNQ